jgi:flagellar hook protein FlgE
MKSTPTLLLFLSILISSISLYSQYSYFEYTYDASGNRTQRKVIIITPTPPQAAAAVVPDTARQEVVASTPAPDSTQSFKTEDATIVKTNSTTLLIADVYPNPTYGIVNVMISEQGTFTGVLYNMEGKAVMQEALNSGQNMMDLSNVGDGQFILRITSADGRTQEFKIIKKS